MRVLIYTLLFWLTASAYAQVRGNAQLLGETDHSGIKVLFTAVSPTAKTDSTVTDVKGDYTKVLTGGTYSIKFSKSGYYDSTYKQNVFVNGLINLNPVKLISTKIVFASGDVSGVWDSNHVYFVRGSIIAVDSLVVLPGTHIFIDSDNAIGFVGTFKFKGALGDSIYIENLSKSPKIQFSTWTDSHIEFNFVKSNVFIEKNSILGQLANQTDIITNCSFSAFCYALAGNSSIIQYNTSKEFATFRLNQIHYNFADISCNNFVYKVNNTDFNPDGCFFWVNDYLNPMFDSIKGKTINIHNNILSFNGARNGKTYKNIFNENQNTNIYDERFNLVTADTLIPIGGAKAGGKILFNNNLIKNYPSEINIFGKSVSVEGNTFITESGLSQNFNINKGIVIRNNILGKINLTNRSNSGAIFNYNQISSGSTFVNLEGAGIPIVKNSKNSDIDTYLNVIEDPQFTHAPLLASTSPMLGAGANGTNIGFDPKGTCLEDYFKNWVVTDPHKGDTLSISGKVLVSDVSTVEASVKAVNVVTHKEFTAATDNVGNFLLDSLPLGNYYIVTTPGASLASLYQTTYYPKRASLQQADTLKLKGNIVDMKIYLLSTTVGLDDEEFVSEVYPNPFKNELVLENKNNGTFSIADASGRILYESQKTSETLNTQNWPQGLYFVKFDYKVVKFVKE